VGCNTHVHRHNTRNFPVHLSSSQTSKNAVFSYMFFLQQNWRTRGLQLWGVGAVAQIMYTHVSNCKSDKIKLKKKRKNLNTDTRYWAHKGKTM
jgi:hypothetical protein